MGTLFEGVLLDEPTIPLSFEVLHSSYEALLVASCASAKAECFHSLWPNLIGCLAVTLD